MDQYRATLTAQLKLRLIWIALAALVVVGLVVVVLVATGPITFPLVFAAVLGTFFTFVLGGGLFAVSFYSARSGFDRDAATFLTKDSSAGSHTESVPAELEQASHQ